MRPPFGIERLPAIGPAVITLGVFDGVHRGHRAILEATTTAARERQAASVALVFTPHPDEVLRPGTTVPRLLPPERSLEAIEAVGIGHAIPVRFDDELRSLAPEAFLAALAPAIELRGIVMTPGSAFGRGRAGTLARVREIGDGAGFDAIAVDPLLIDDAPVSSSRIRDALAAGDLDAARRLLGRAPVLEGTVIHGDRRGRELGFPTANLGFDYPPALPALGIYLGRVSCPAREVGPDHPALVSIGVRPTFHEHGLLLVEVYLLDWDGDLYETTLEVALEARLRDERRFTSVDELVAQMRADEAHARRLLAEG
ncbi:MAG TPA: riboflavin biosynthesis protein RibF [Candidatus Limnocylindria bacterium]|nr:riboflavin biosynthesis protein RibF [Candidatus Limnocylindria bacterium]